jgi:hypothetical protein
VSEIKGKKETIPESNQRNERENENKEREEKKKDK